MNQESKLSYRNWTYMSPRQRREFLRQEGYHDIEYRGYVYKFINPKVDPAQFKRNLDFLHGLDDLRDEDGTTVAPREGCPVDRRFSSLSKVKQLNRKFPYKKPNQRENRSNEHG